MIRPYICVDGYFGANYDIYLKLEAKLKITSYIQKKSMKARIKIVFDVLSIKVSKKM